MNEFERKFVVDSEGIIEEKALTEEEKLRIDESKNKKKLVRLPALEKDDARKFEADAEGNIKEIKK